MAEAEFSRKTVLITGAGGGVGSALVKVFADFGAELILCDLRLDMLPEGRANYAFDLADNDAVTSAVDRILSERGAPDIIINNAGWTRAETMKGLTARTIEDEIQLNLTGVSVFTNAFLPAMADKGGGSIVFISSVNALAHFGNPAYAAAKAGIVAFSRAIAVEQGRRGIRSNVVCPGSVRTDAWTHRLAKDPTVMDPLNRLYPLGRIVETAEVANAVAFLASDRASGITGITMPVDAGLTAGYLPFIDDILGGT